MTQFPLPPDLADDLRRVAELVLERTHSRAAVINVAGPHLLRSDRGRVRAALVLLAARTGTYATDQVVHAAAAAELIYAATRTHGDMVDEAERRRGVARVGEWGQGLPLMVGDYLFALAAGEMARTPDPRVIGYYSEAVMRITEAALAPPPPLRPVEPAATRHLERLGGAAALVAAACKAGGACAGVAPAQIETLGRFGQELGLALALAEEARDFGPEGIEAPAASLRSGAVTLPLIMAAHHGDGERLAAALDHGDEAEHAWVAAEVRRHGLTPARAAVARLVAAARDALAELSPSPGRDALALAAGYPLQIAPPGLTGGDPPHAGG